MDVAQLSPTVSNAHWVSDNRFLCFTRIEKKWAMQRSLASCALPKVTIDHSCQTVFDITSIDVFSEQPPTTVPLCFYVLYT